MIRAVIGALFGRMALHSLSEVRGRLEVGKKGVHLREVSEGTRD